ncbi:MAG: formylglycine-generating enzyme family protein [Desertifilum sp.]|nr:formylglycine-generating enzyme family protein [Desertifilum sp.]
MAASNAGVAMNNALEIDPKLKDANQRIQDFRQRFGEAHLEFACHAAFPLALTPDLLYRLRDYLLKRETSEMAPRNRNRVSGNSEGETDKFSEKPGFLIPGNPVSLPPQRLQVPWLAVSDLLSSRLCYEIGRELYEMEPSVRKLLLERLAERYGEARLGELSDFLLKYIKRHFRFGRDIKQAQFWTALAYAKPGEAAQEIAVELNRLLQQPNFSLWLQKASLLETLAEPLKGYEPLLTLAKAMGNWAKGESVLAEQQLRVLREQKGTVLQVAEVTIHLPPPPIVVKTFSFETVRVNRRGEEVEQETHEARYFTEDLGQGVMLEMVYIPGGTFLMGSPKGEGNKDEKPQHSVTVPAFFMAKYPVTQAQWRAVAALPQEERSLKADPAEFKGDNRPVERVTWFDAVEFCARLSKKVGRKYVLPSEAQWEYACRAGTTTPFYFGETITTQLVNYHGNYTYAEEPKGEYREETTPVGSFPPNAFGLYDMHGNVYEWCLDDWHDSYQGAPEDGSAWLDGNDNLSQKPNDSRAILRGGSWLNIPHFCRSAYRLISIIDERGNNSNAFGFRVACVAGRTFNP